MHAQHHDWQRRPFTPHLFEDVEPARPRHTHVEHHQIPFAGLDLRQPGLAVTGLADDDAFDAIDENLFDSLPDDRMIIDEQNADQRCFLGLAARLAGI
jgi:hypothetical protein